MTQEKGKPGQRPGTLRRGYQGQRRINVLVNQEESACLEGYCKRENVTYAEAIRRGLKKLEKEN